MLESLKTILVVDDSKINIEVINEILSDEFLILPAQSGEEALETVNKYEVDLILLDIILPGMNGYEVCSRLKRNEATKKIPIVFITSMNNIEFKRKGFELGAVDFITKPFQAYEIKARVKTHMSLNIYKNKLECKNKELESQVKERTTKLSDALQMLEDSTFETIVRLSRAAEYRDDNTGNHVLCVGHYSALLAKKMGLGDEKAQKLLLAAPMHDIGKIGIPDSILLTPAKLDKDEWLIMKAHTTIGAKILERSNNDIIKMGEMISLTHHEKWNGTGYPRGIKSSELPLETRIVALADVYDALTSKRPYKEPISTEDACEIIKKDKGEHFDPDVVDVFFNSLDTILKIKEKYNKVEDINIDRDLWTIDDE